MRYLNVATLLAAIWWSTVLVAWAEVSDPHSSGVSITLSGSELSQTLTLMPAIVILVSMIARYRKIPNQIMFFAALVAFGAAYIAFTLNAAATPAAVEGLENLTGIAGVIGVQSLTLGPLSYSLLAVLVAGVSVMSALTSPEERVREATNDGQDPSDPRSIWDSQS